VIVFSSWSFRYPDGARLGIKNIRFIVQDLSKLNLPKNSFDVIYAHLSLHYFTHQTTKKLFCKLYNILKKSGLLFFKCKSTNDLLYGQGHKIEEDMYNLGGHVHHFFNKKTTAKLLVKYQKVSIYETEAVYNGHKSHFIEVFAEKEINLFF